MIYTSARSMIRGELSALFGTVEGIAFYERVAVNTPTEPYAIWKVVDSVTDPDDSRESDGADITQGLVEITFSAQASEIEEATDRLLQSVRTALLAYQPSSNGETVRYNAGTEAGTMKGVQYNSHHPRVEATQSGTTRCRLYVTFIAHYRWQKVKV